MFPSVKGLKMQPQAWDMLPTGQAVGPFCQFLSGSGSQLSPRAPTPVCLHQSSTGPGAHGPSQKRVIPSRGLTFLNPPWGGEV